MEVLFNATLPSKRREEREEKEGKQRSGVVWSGEKREGNSRKQGASCKRQSRVRAGERACKK